MLRVLKSRSLAPRRVPPGASRITVTRLSEVLPADGRHHDGQGGQGWVKEDGPGRIWTSQEGIFRDKFESLSLDQVHLLIFLIFLAGKAT